MSSILIFELWRMSAVLQRLFVFMCVYYGVFARDAHPCQTSDGCIFFSHHMENLTTLISGEE